MRSITRTAMGARFQLEKVIGAPSLAIANSTLDEAINNSAIVPFQPAIPTIGMELPDDYNYQTDTGGRLQYFAIGSGGHFSVTGATGTRPKMGRKPHSARETGFFEMIPFVIKNIEDDLTPEQRENYRLRKVLEVNGQLKVAYFLRRIDLSNATIVQNIVKKDKNVITSQPYRPTANDLDPADPVVNGTNDGTYIQTLVPVDLVFNSLEAQWLREVAQVWYGDANEAIISEIALCSGFDKPITKRYSLDPNNQTVQTIASSLKEAQQVRISVIESLYHQMAFTNGSLTEKIFIGTEDPLYGTNYATTNP